MKNTNKNIKKLPSYRDKLNTWEADDMVSSKIMHFLYQNQCHLLLIF